MDKITQIKKYAQTLVYTRWTKEELEKHLQEKFNLTSTLEEIDESGCVADYAFLMGIYDYYGHIDVYFLKVPYDEKDIFVTEISVSAE